MVYIITLLEESPIDMEFLEKCFICTLPIAMASLQQDSEASALGFAADRIHYESVIFVYMPIDDSNALRGDAPDGSMLTVNRIPPS